MELKSQLIKERNQGINQLHTDIVTIKGIMDDLALLAESQDIYYDDIESNIENVRTHIVTARNELEKADETHRKKSKWKLFGGLGGGIGGITALLITLGVMKKI